MRVRSPHRISPEGGGTRRRRGSVLIVALVVLFALVGLVLTMTRTSHTDAALAANNRSTHQADAIARGAEQFVLALVTDYRDSLSTLTETDFSQVPVGDGYFWITRPNYNDQNLPTFGLMDESSKLNLNTASVTALSTLEGMTDQIAGAIVDWRDEDETPEATGGAETPDYLSLTNAYRAKNADFEAVEELLLLKGMTRELYQGNGTTQGTAQAFGNTYYQTNGLRDFFTVWSTRAATAADGTQRVSIAPPANNPQARQALLDLLRIKLTEARANEIIAAIGDGIPVDLFDFARRANMTTDEVSKIEDFVFSASGARGPVNINTAPREVLVALVAAVSQIRGATLTEADIDSLIARRSTNAATDTPTISWVWDVLKETSVGMGRFICARGEQYSADIVAVGRGGRSFKHVRIVVDAAQSPPRIVYRRDLTDAGWPLDPQILASIQSGKSATMAGNVGTGVR